MPRRGRSNTMAWRYKGRPDTFRTDLIHRLLEKRTNDSWSISCVVIAPVERRNQEKTYSFDKEKDPLPSKQCTVADLRSFDGQNYGIKIRIITASTVFTGFGPQ